MISTEWRQRADCSAGPDACWLWLGSIHPDGYAIGWFRDLNRTTPVPRVVLAETLGRPIAPGKYACHHCDNRRCVNPAHIYEGGPASNGQDKAVRGRARNGYTKARLGPALYDGTIGQPLREMVDEATGTSA